MSIIKMLSWFVMSIADILMEFNTLLGCLPVLYVSCFVSL